MNAKPAAEHLVHTLRSQGRFCGSSGSPMYHELFELVAKDVEAGGVFATILSGHEGDSARHAVPLRLLGGLHRLVLDGRAAAGIPVPVVPGTASVPGPKSCWPRPTIPARYMRFSFNRRRPTRSADLPR